MRLIIQRGRLRAHAAAQVLRTRAARGNWMASHWDWGAASGRGCLNLLTTCSSPSLAPTPPLAPERFGVRHLSSALSEQLVALIDATLPDMKAKVMALVEENAKALRDMPDTLR